MQEQRWVLVANRQLQCPQGARWLLPSLGWLVAPLTLASSEGRLDWRTQCPLLPARLGWGGAWPAHAPQLLVSQKPCGLHCAWKGVVSKRAGQEVA